MGEGQPSTGPILLSWAVAAVAAVAEAPKQAQNKAIRVAGGSGGRVDQGNWVSSVRGDALCRVAAGLPAEAAWPGRPLQQPLAR
jgi:hypothetical protein